MLIRHGSGEWHEPTYTGYATEGALEMLLAQSPHLLPWDLSEGLATASQVQLPTGIADLIGVGLRGEIVIIECKLRSNAEVRRHVVGQVFAYASALWRMSYDAFADRWSRAATVELRDAVCELAGRSGTEWSEQDFRSAVTANLEQGRFRLLVAVDAITEELRGIIEYVNSHTIPDLQLLALQLEYRRDGDVEILLPTVYGQEAVRSKERQAPNRTTEERLFAALKESCSPEGYRAVRKLHDWWAARGLDFYWGTGQQASVTGYYNANGLDVIPWACWTGPRHPSISPNFEYLRKLPRERLERFFDAICTIPGAAEWLRGVREADFRKRPGIRIAPVFAAPGAMDTFLAALGDLIAPDIEQNSATEGEEA